MIRKYTRIEHVRSLHNYATCHTAWEWKRRAHAVLKVLAVRAVFSLGRMRFVKVNLNYCHETIKTLCETYLKG